MTTLETLMDLKDKFTEFGPANSWDWAIVSPETYAQLANASERSVGAGIASDLYAIRICKIDGEIERLNEAMRLALMGNRVVYEDGQRNLKPVPIGLVNCLNSLNLGKI